jgi:type VI protein secretion system component VasK
MPHFNAMIETQSQILGSLEYAAKWADVLEGLRVSAAEAGTEVAVLTTALGGPLSEIRRVLAEANKFLEA